MDIPQARCGPARYHRRTADALWHEEPMKDAASCDNPRRGAHILRQGLEWANPSTAVWISPPQTHRGGEDNRGTETSKYPEGGKSISRLPSSGERRDRWPNRRAGIPSRVPPTGCRPRIRGLPPRAQVRLGSGTAWEGRRPQRVTAPYANPDRTARRGP